MEKERRTKVLLLSALVVVVATLSIAFASLSRTLNINGIGKMDTASWSVHLGEVSNPVVTGNPILDNVKITYNASASTLNITGVELHYGDEVKYNIEIVNDGTIDAILNRYTINNNLTFKGSGDLAGNDENNVKHGFKYDLSYFDGSPIEVNTETNQDDLIIRAGSSKTYTLSISYKESLSPIIQDGVKVSGMKITLRYIQLNE